MSSLPFLSGNSKRYYAPSTNSTFLHSERSSHFRLKVEPLVTLAATHTPENLGSDESNSSSSREAESSPLSNDLRTLSSSMISIILGTTYEEISSDVESQTAQDLRQKLADLEEKKKIVMLTRKLNAIEEKKADGFSE